MSDYIPYGYEAFPMASPELHPPVDLDQKPDPSEHARRTAVIDTVISEGVVSEPIIACRYFESRDFSGDSGTGFNDHRNIMFLELVRLGDRRALPIGVSKMIDAQERSIIYWSSFPTGDAEIDSEMNLAHTHIIDTLTAMSMKGFFDIIEE